MLTRYLGAPSGNMPQDVAALYDYIAYLSEQLNYTQQLLEKKTKGEMANVEEKA